MPKGKAPYKKGKVGDAEFANAKSDRSSYVIHRTTKDSRGWSSEAEASGSMPIGGGTHSELARQKRLGNKQTASGPKSRGDAKFFKHTTKGK